MTKAKMPNVQKKKKEEKKSNKMKVDRYVSVPVARGRQSVVSGPRLRQNQPGTITVSHREWVCAVTGSVTGYTVVVNEPLNPGLSTVFPWLCALANNYDTYHVDKFVVEYIPTCPTNTPGQMMALLDYDALDSTPPSGVGEFNNTYGAVSGPVWAPLRMACEPRFLNTIVTRYTRRGVHSVQDQKTYDFGRIVLAASGSSQVSPGQLFVDYTITFHLPQVRLLDEIEAESQKTEANDAGVTNNTPFGVEPTTTGGAGIRVASNTMYFPKVGQYLVDMLFTGTNCTGLDLTQAGEALKLTAQKVVATGSIGGAYSTYAYLVNVIVAGAFWSVTHVPSTTVTGSVLRFAPYLTSLL